MRFKKIIRLFEQGNVCITGLRGCGKDMLMSNVVVRRREPYVSNLDYSGELLSNASPFKKLILKLKKIPFVPVKMYQELDFNKIDLGETTYKDLINGTQHYYAFPYIQGSDIYISDAGVYFPSQYCNELNRDYKHLPMYFALSRQVSHNNVHINVQNLNRAWDKIREQSDIYIRCRSCIVLFGTLVIQRITLYDKYQSCLDRVEPCKIGIPLLAKREVKQNAELYLDKFRNSYGSIKNRMLIYINKSSYDTYYFEKLFLKGDKKNENKSR